MIFRDLHQIQNDPANDGYLPESQLRALAARTGTPLYRLQELASFYPHFRLSRPPKVEVHVCRDMSCHLHGATRLTQKLSAAAGKLKSPELNVGEVSCLGRCDRGPIVRVNHHYYSQDAIAGLAKIIQDALAGRAAHADDDRPLSFATPDTWQIDPYEGPSDYRGIRQFMANPDAQRILKELETAELLGMGGAGAPAFRKWTDVAQALSLDGEKFVVCNGDESEPGTFKDRELLLYKPHLVVEGVALAALTVGAGQAYIFIRHEYPDQIREVRRAIAAAESQNVLGAKILGTDRSLFVEVFESPGGYICGEQGALIEAIEGHRAQPRNRPPQLETNGLHNKPTLLNNVETFAWAVRIALDGGAWYRDRGAPGYKGLRFFSISGDVNRPAAYEIPIGTPLRTLVHDLAGGILGDREFLGIAPSGPSGGFLPARLPLAGLRVPEVLKKNLAPDATHLDLLDLPLDLGLFRQLGLMLGAGIVVYAQGTDMLDQALNCTQFFRNESCGKCVPCRLGSQKLVEIGQAISSARENCQASQEREYIRDLALAMEMTSICGLGVSAPNPLVTWFKYFQPNEAPAAPGGDSPGKIRQ